MTDIKLYDEHRDRQITVTYWYPSDHDSESTGAVREGEPLKGGDEIFPLLVLIHGIEDNAPATWPYLAPFLASHGYVVMAPSTGSTLSTTQDLVNHPGDVSFLIDIATSVAGPENPFAGRIDESRIGLGGFSFGAAAAYMLAYDPEFRDARLRAIILIAGGGTQPAPINPAASLLTLFGTEDILIPYDLGLNIYEAANPPKYLVTLQGGGHAGFSSSNDINFGASMTLERQQSLTRVSVLAFLTSVLDTSQRNRDAGQSFIVELLPEQPDVYVLAAPSDD